ncbi:hypothetical protein CVT24_008674 [Panaeolus cyanescens]|uniref:Uncharacterized protein n=1 Tax=Panaeolus cyanescens TaxID=181874 RepID=A0A409WED3_9AGAR|nr:hypothetical protein CVT24_008674 [Panaeolus cyanescens]
MSNNSPIEDNSACASFYDPNGTFTITDPQNGTSTMDETHIFQQFGNGKAARENKVEKWLKSSPETKDELQRQAFSAVLAYISDDPKIANLVYEMDDFKDKLGNFITEGQKRAENLRKQLALDNIDLVNGQVESISFSRVTRDTLERRLGVTFHNATEPFKSKALKVFLTGGAVDTTTSLKAFELKALSDNFNQYWSQWTESRRNGRPKPRHHHSDFLVGLDNVLLYTSQKLEAGSRQMIDSVFSGLAHMLMSSNYEVVQFPELKVSTTNHAIAPIFHTVDHCDPLKRTTIILGGSIDYALVVISPDNGLPRQPGTASTYATGLLKCLNSDQDVSALWNTVLKINGDTERESSKYHLLFVEAKRPAVPTSTTPGEIEATKAKDRIDWLKKHEAQAVAEAMAGCREQTDERLRPGDFMALPWCLTDGIYWVIGMVTHTYGQSGWRCYELAIAHNDRVPLSEEYPELKELMRILYFLAVVPPSDVFRLMID